MKKYTCKTCGHMWMTNNPSLECTRFGCGSRNITEENGSPFGSSPSPIGTTGFTRTGGGSAKALLANLLQGLSGLGAALLCILAGPGILYNDLMLIAAVLAGILTLMAIPAAILLLCHLHRAWLSLQNDPAQSTGGITPGQAIGLLFVPFFNLYWAFIAYGRLWNIAESIRLNRRLPGDAFQPGWGIANAIGFVIQWAVCFSALALYLTDPYLIVLHGRLLLAFFAIATLMRYALFFKINLDLVRLINTIERR